MTRHKFSGEFKSEAVRLLTDRGAAASQAAHDLQLFGGVAYAAG